MVNLKPEYYKNGNTILKTLNILKRSCFLMFFEKTSSCNCYALNTNCSYSVSEEKYKIWDWLLQQPPDSLLNSTKQLDSPDILNQIYLEGFTTEKTSRQEGNVKYFSSGRVILAAVHISIQELFSLASQVTAQVQEDRSTLVGMRPILAYSSHDPQV